VERLNKLFNADILTGKCMLHIEKLLLYPLCRQNLISMQKFLSTR